MACLLDAYQSDFLWKIFAVEIVRHSTARPDGIGLRVMTGKDSACWVIRHIGCAAHVQPSRRVIQVLLRNTELDHGFKALRAVCAVTGNRR